MNSVLLIAGYATLAAAIVLFAVVLRRRRDEPQEPEALASPPRRVLEDEGISLREFEMEDLKDRLCELMERERLYLNPNIRVSDVAARLYTNKSYLSQAIRTKLNKNFCQLVHSYRVREAMRLYSVNQNISIVDMCKKVGFNSMATFTSAFSRNTGFTPADWCRQYKRQSLNELSSKNGLRRQKNDQTT
ncbi:MAG: helix-turn-helix domain-containing protein [Bacteroidales bacterium]|nr:helix-turn-helix domain-containing protein [Candidatus Cacconaster equi]